MVRKLTHAVGTCKICGSAAVYEEKRIKGSLYWAVHCCNKSCGKKTQFYANKKHALQDWNQTWEACNPARL